MAESEERVAGLSEVVVIASPEQLWSPMALRGVLSVVFGVIALLWPGITVLALALLFGAWALVDGISFLVTAFRLGRAHANWREWLPVLLAGLLGVGVAVITARWLAITVLALSVLVALLLIGVGVAEMVVAVRVRKLVRWEMFLVVAGVVAVLTGVAILIWPQLGILALTVALGGYALVAGILLILGALRLRGIARGRRSSIGHGPTVTGAQPSGT